MNGNQYTISDFRRDSRNGPYAWPGAYPVYFICNDGEALSFAAAKENRRLILESIRDDSRDGWQVIAAEINWEDIDLYCSHSGETIESAYGESQS